GPKPARWDPEAARLTRIALVPAVPRAPHGDRAVSRARPTPAGWPDAARMAHRMGRVTTI
ncbi:MAG: hypothetical protein AVDCRST_MAG88-3780, partial [uncultured Thermomicrobiales bacterium]